MTDQHFRLRQGGRIDRGTVLRFTVDGRELTGHPGDTVASAMLANGIVEVAPSLYRSRPRGIVAAGVEEPNALLQIDGSCSEGMLLYHNRRAVRRTVRHHALRHGPTGPDP